MSDARRHLPAVDALLGDPGVASLLDAHPRSVVVRAVRDTLDAARGNGGAPPPEGWAAAVGTRAANLSVGSLEPVINATGVVLHTNLGRAVLAEVAIQALERTAREYSALEYDLGRGARGSRYDHCRALLAELTGAEDALVVNNAAAGLLLSLTALARGGQAVVSRGELIEIGGAFRMPDIMARAGVKLVEVGTTNRTHLKDYEGAISPRTAALMKVHTSNYAVHGFTAAVPEEKLAALAHRHKLPLITDLGSGMLVDLEDYGLPHEPTPREALAAGADIVTFSGDKLLGGPQAGLIVGRKDLVERIRKNPMKRALRVDKMTLAALEAVLRLYADPARLKTALPTLRFLTRPAAEIEAQAQRLLPAVESALRGKAGAEVVPVKSQIGSGSLPVDLIASHGIAVATPGKRRNALAAGIAAAFRALPVPVIGRVTEGAFIMDLRCLEDEDEFVEQLKRLELSGLNE